MRQAQKSNRSRGRGNRKSGGGGGNNLNRVYDSAGPEGKVRGTPQQIIDKYVSLARDAQTSGDRVTAENFLQHAEHYQRILITATTAQEQARRENGQQPSNEQPQPQQQADDQPQPAAVITDDQAAQMATTTAQPATEVAAEQPASDIGGMAMIEQDTAKQETLLVESEDIAKSQPKGNGDGRSRRRKPAADDAAEATAAEAPAADAAVEG